ncbi:HAMP domain-containing histidine kinase [Anaerotignum lactatifermentans]|uniref:histidine kinase n=1 Tax=Anaerotignum lactatifermentans TaxID=160404 RepID=A0ABS2G8L3_9FIRM|nr:HAMP domain-containing sensor histidine kinase [Anaerotignum lactatifermentans]MBM6829253.1 HAMP domain-containing histidine kinase [Anaerotignum lactatifermentans]MBM6877507.1 HAMP domain-containing histidine kinase [Anaerotignum lactatifermentans]MBM6950831.1 HAMP domain-containing histidine kinase [Anaerotignum lactatifermentans]
MRIKSIATKQFLLYVGTLTVCLMIMGASLSVAYTRHYMNGVKDELIEQGRKISSAISKAYVTGEVGNLAYEMQVLEDYMGAGVLLMNDEGVIVLTSPGMDKTLLGQVLAYEELVEGVREGNIVSLQTGSSTVFGTPMMVVGYPISTGSLAGIFMCRSLPEIELSLHEMYRSGLVSLLLAFMVSILVSIVTSRRMTEPMMEMNKAAKVIAGGNFEQRVEIYSEDELGQLAESFNHMAESLQNTETTRRNFIANISHDLRSPLTSIQGFLTAMLDGTIPPERQEHYLQIVLEETQRLSRLAEGVVEMSRAQSAKIILEETDFDINELIRENSAILEPQMQEKNLSLQVSLAEKVSMVRADRDKISRVIRNLMGNAVKFSNADGVIEVETTLSGKNKILVSVQDHGAGISEEDQKYIFDRFYKADATRNQDKTGMGLGLSIVREFLQAHGETIAVKSKEGEGSKFVFSLRLADKK